jgi:hypothetical protein
MSRNDAEDFAQRLYARVPGNYLVYDEERGQPLLALLRVVGAQVANVRQDLDALWDNFFIETCDEWVVPYIGALLGANLLQQPVGQSNRLDVWNTVLWRRSRGTPQMLEALAQAISGWPADLTEFFLALGWSQNLNHVRLDRPLTPDVRDPRQLALLGHADDPFAHAADFKPGRPLDSPRVQTNSIGVGRAGWGTSGRYQIGNLGVFVRRLQTFPMRGATPAGAMPGAHTPAGTSCFTFNPLFRDVPLFAADSAASITRAAFAADPWASFGSESDIAVRQYGILLASETAPAVRPSASSTPCTFSGVTSGITLADMRLLHPISLQLGSAHFLITAKWQEGTTSTNLGFLSTLFAVSGNSPAFRAGSTGSGAAQLVITVQTGRDGLGWTGPALPFSPAARFPGAVIAICIARSGPRHSGDGLYVYLPPSLITPDDVLTYFVADDGSTYTSSNFSNVTPARSSEGPVYPPRSADPSTAPALTFLRLNREPGAMVLTDPTRFSGANVLLETALFTGPSTFQTLGGIATAVHTAAVDTDLQAPIPWPAFTFAPSQQALTGNISQTGLLSILLRPLTGDFIPPSELVLVNRDGQSLLVYLPEVPANTEGTRLLVADDGSTYFAPTDASLQQSVLQDQSLVGLVLARAAQGQVLPIPGYWPLQQRLPVAINLCSAQRSSLLSVGELGIDPELGRFALPPDDPAIALTSPPQGLGFDRSTLSVDFVEALTSFVGAVNSTQRQISPVAANRFVSRSGDADASSVDKLSGAPVHSSLADAINAAKDGDIIEVVDSATYDAAGGVSLPPSLKTLTIRAAAGQRPCLPFYQSAGVASGSSFTVASPMSQLSLEGLLISGGPLVIQAQVQQLQLIACTLDPSNPNSVSILATDANLNSNATYIFSRCVTGGMRAGKGIGQLTVADSIVDQQGGVAISGNTSLGSPPILQQGLENTPAARAVQLERVTVLGAIVCDVFNASESLLNDLAIVSDRQSGCIRFTRFEIGSLLPRRYRCVPDESQAAACNGESRCVAPLFNSRQFGRPDYAQLAGPCPAAILTASEESGEVGAFAGAQNTIRLGNLLIKLQEFMPVSLSAVIVAET